MECCSRIGIAMRAGIEPLDIAASCSLRRVDVTSNPFEDLDGSFKADCSSLRAPRRLPGCGRLPARSCRGRSAGILAARGSGSGPAAPAGDMPAHRPAYLQAHQNTTKGPTSRRASGLSFRVRAGCCGARASRIRHARPRRPSLLSSTFQTKNDSKFTRRSLPTMHRVGSFAYLAPRVRVFRDVSSGMDKYDK